MARFLRLAPGLYLLGNGGLLLCSPRWFVRVHTLPFYPPWAKQRLHAIGTHERASRAVGLAATVAGVVCLLIATNRPFDAHWRGMLRRAG
jgi:hypothetical protein